MMMMIIIIITIYLFICVLSYTGYSLMDYGLACRKKYSNYKKMPVCTNSSQTQ